MVEHLVKKFEPPIPKVSFPSSLLGEQHMKVDLQDIIRNEYVHGYINELGKSRS